MVSKGEKAGQDQRDGVQPLLRASGSLRTGVFLAINLAGYAVVNGFWQYLATGQWYSFRLSAYRRAMTALLGEMFLHPLNILHHPWMILVAGLLLGLVILVPIVVAVLYRAVFAALFVAIVVVLGQTPMLALFLAVGCVLAARTTLRSEMPLLACMMGLAPVAVYLYFFAFVAPDAPAALPLQKWVFYAPYILAGLTAVIGSAAVLLLARLTKFRPGVVWPVLVILLAGPITVFYTKVGPEELDYGLLVEGLEAGGGLFREELLRDWKLRKQAEGLDDAAQEQMVREELRRRKQEMVQRCERFLERHEDGRRAAEVRWLRAQATSLDISESALKDPQAGLIRYSPSYCAAESAPAWQLLRDRHPGTPQAALAEWRLGELAIRRGGPQNVREGYDMLRRAVQRLGEIASAPVPAAGTDRGVSIFLSPEPLPDRRHYAEALFETERLVWLIERNGLLEDTPESFGAAETLRAYLNANPNQLNYADELRRVYERTSKGTPLEDNLRLAVARATARLEEKADALMELEALRDGTDGGPTDAAVAAKYELGLLALRPGDVEKLQMSWAQSREPAVRARRLRSPEEYFRQVMQSDQQPWKRLAEARLALLRGPAEAEGD